jgi:hypothetical protein
LLQTTMKQGGTLIPAFSRVEGFIVMAVERLQGGLQFHRNAERVEHPAFAPAFFGHLLADVLPQFPEHGHFIARDVLGTGTRGSLTMPHSMASISEKSHMVQGNRVPSR